MPTALLLGVLALGQPPAGTCPINLATALQLASARPLDVAIAAKQVEIAARQYDRARLLWVPNVIVGVDYFRHEGGQQNFAGDILRSSRGSTAIGVGPNVVFSASEAWYAPLAAKQDLAARQATREAATRDATLAVTDAYFGIQQARGELAGAMLAVERAEEIVRKVTGLAESLVPVLEVSRAKVELARRKQAVSFARERWSLSSAELARLLRLDPTTLFEPAEPPFLTIPLIALGETAETLVPVALTNRPELAAHQAVVKATLARLKQEKHRPLLPSLALRSTATNPSGSIAYGGFGGGANDRVANFGSRFDIDAQLLWEFSALGFGNRARVGERRAEHELATLELFRTQDRIAAEVASAFANVTSATERLALAEPALKDSTELTATAIAAMGQARRTGEIVVLVVRPQEVVSAVQAFGQANADFYAAVADYNRAQFRLYRALGHAPGALAAVVPAK